MSMTKIHVSVTDQVLKVTESPVIASGGVQEISVVFDFCSLWDGFTKTAVFYMDEENKYYMLVDENDTCTVPQEVYEEAGTFYFGVFGVKDETRRTSTVAKYKVRDGAITSDLHPSDPTPGIYDQLLAATGEARNIAQSIRDDADEMFANAEAVIAEADSSAKNAFNASARANVAANNAEQAAALTNTATENANTAATHATEEANKATQATVAALNATEVTNQARETFLEEAGAAIDEIVAIAQEGKDAPPIICSANGEVIAVKDSAKRMLRGLNLFGKTTQFKTTGAQLITSARAISKVEKGITYTVNSDKSVSAKGTATASAYLLLDGDFSSGAIPIPDFLVVGNKYYLQDAVLCLYTKDGQGITFNAGSFTMPDGYDYWGVFVFVPSGSTVDKTYYPMLNAGDTAIPWEPYTGGKASPNPDYPQELVSAGASGVINVTVTGKNLIPPSADAPTAQGIASSPDEFGTVVLNGTATQEMSRVVSKNFLLPAGTYTLSVKGLHYVDGNKDRVYMNAADGSGTIVNYVLVDKPVTFNLAKSTIVRAAVVLAAGSTYKNEVVSIQLETGTVATEYEPYKEQTLTVSTPNGLPGIPVSSGGNYTDENGQQWVCDEIDFAKGVRVQRIGEVTLNGTEQWKYHSAGGINQLYLDFAQSRHNPDSIGAMCQYYKPIPISERSFNYNTVYTITDGLGFNTLETKAVDEWKELLATRPTTVQYILKTPIETDLAAEEIAAFKALHSNYPNTTVLNDAGAWMEVSYNADTKAFIQNNVFLTDETTGIMYRLKINNGKLYAESVE